MNYIKISLSLAVRKFMRIFPWLALVAVGIYVSSNLLSDYLYQELTSPLTMQSITVGKTK